MSNYQTRRVKGRVKGTGYPIDGHILYFSQWEWDDYSSSYLRDWDDKDEEAVMLTMYQSEQEAGLCLYDTLEEFIKAWKAKEWKAQGAFCLDLDQVEEIEVINEEVKDDGK